MNEASPDLPPSHGPRPAWRRGAFWVVVLLWWPIVGGIGWMLWRSFMTGYRRQEARMEAARRSAETARSAREVFAPPPEPEQRIMLPFSQESLRRAARRLAGVEGPRQYAIAVNELKVDAALGNPDALVLLAEALLDGDPANGVAPNRSEAQRWLQRPAAAQSSMYPTLLRRLRRQDELEVIAANTPPGSSDAQSAKGLDRFPQPTRQERPIYPLALLFLEITGEVTVEFLVDAQGNVRNAVATKSSHAGFERAAIEAVSVWKFQPGQKNGQAVTTRMAVPIVFTLNEEPAPR